MKSFNIIDPIKLSEMMANSKNHIPAIWFVAGLEGNIAHRNSMDYVLRISRENRWLPIIMFEDPGYISRKDRKEEFLPLSLRMSMWSLYCMKRGNIGIITLNPQRVVPVRFVDDFYESLFKSIGGRVCFSNSFDTPSVHLSRFFRGDYFDDRMLIPYTDTLSTTDLVRV